jgi:hypothetical protein
MSTLQYKFEFATRTMLRLSDIEEILEEQRIFRTLPSRKNLIEMCEEGIFEATKTRYGWMVFEDSFDGWVQSLQQQRLAA